MFTEESKSFMTDMPDMPLTTSFMGNDVFQCGNQKLQGVKGRRKKLIEDYFIKKIDTFHSGLNRK